MTWTQSVLYLLDGKGNLQTLIAYTDGTNYSFAHPLLDNTGAIIAPATSGNQTTMITALNAIATAAELSSTSALQTSGNTLLSEIQASLAGTLEIIGSVSTAANTTGGASVYAAWGGDTNPVLTNTPAAIKASAGNLYGLVSVYNPNASSVFLQLFDAATGSVTVGTTAPKAVIQIPAGAVYDRAFTDESKLSFATAITVAVTTTPTGGTAPATGVSGNITYK